jgi:hypothetical protein
MRNERIQDKLEKMRETLETMSGESTGDADPGKSGAPDTEDSSEHNGSDGEIPGSDNTDQISGDLSSQFKNLMSVLEKELKDSNPVTLLVVFVFGLLFGRLLSR